METTAGCTFSITGAKLGIDVRILVRYSVVLGTKLGTPLGRTDSPTISSRVAPLS
mgnify:CR=1 FL=1